MKITEKELQVLKNKIADLTGMSTSQPTAKSKGQTTILILEKSPTYGGYLFAEKDINTGVLYDVFGESTFNPRKTAKEMHNFMKGLIVGLTYQK